MSCCPESKTPKYNIEKNVSRPEPKNKIIVPEPERNERGQVGKKKINIVFDLNQSEDFYHKARAMERIVQKDLGDAVFVKVRYRPDTLEAIYVQQGELRDMNGVVRRGGGSGWIVETALGGSMFVTEDQFSKLFEIVEEEEGE